MDSYNKTIELGYINGIQDLPLWYMIIKYGIKLVKN